MIPGERFEQARRPARLRPVLWLLACLTTGGSAAADSPAGVQLVAVHPATQSNFGRTAEAPILQSSGLELDGERFDLQCATVGRTFTERPEGATDKWPLNFRYQVDLHARRYCDFWCEVTGRFPIQSIDTDTITFHNEGPLVVSTVDRRTGHYVTRAVGDGVRYLVEGKCRPEPFSGFPTMRDAEIK